MGLFSPVAPGHGHVARLGWVALPSYCSKRGWATNIEMGLLSLAKKCKYWWNAGHSSMPVPWPKTEMAFDNQQNLEFDAQGDNGVPPSCWGKLDFANINVGLLCLAKECEHWWNVDHSSSMPVSWKRKTKNFPFTTNKISSWKDSHIFAWAYQDVRLSVLIWKMTSSW